MVMSSIPRIQKLHPSHRMRGAPARAAQYPRAPYVVPGTDAEARESKAQPRAGISPATAQRFWENVFTPYRKRILYPIAVSASLIFLPLAIFDYMRGRVAISALLLCLVAMLVADAAALYRKKPLPVPFAWLLLPGCVAVVLSLATQGIFGALWSFPVVFLSFFVLPRRFANAMSIALLVVGAALTTLGQDAATAARYVLSLSLCLVVINIMLNVLDSLNARLLAQTITDPLTGAFNRRHMDANLEEAIERHRRSFAPASAVLVDIDHFKQVNDRFGHEAGDDVLKSIVALIQSRCRKLDVLFRQGGEEFVLLLPDTRAAEAMVVAETLREAIARAPMLGEEPVTVSIGVGELHPSDTAKDWLRRVDEALYRAKEAGRNRVVSADAHAERTVRPSDLRHFPAS